MAELSYTPTGILVQAQYPEFAGQMSLRSCFCTVTLKSDSAIYHALYGWRDELRKDVAVSLGSG
jgi:hypothetical protein